MLGGCTFLEITQPTNGGDGMGSDHNRGSHSVLLGPAASISVTWKLVRSVGSQKLGGGPGYLSFNTPSGSLTLAGVWGPAAPALVLGLGSVDRPHEHPGGAC